MNAGPALSRSSFWKSASAMRAVSDVRRECASVARAVARSRAIAAASSRSPFATSFCKATTGRMGVRGTSRGAQPSHRRVCETLPMRQAMAPLVPEASFSKRQLAVFQDPLTPLVFDGLQQCVLRLRHGRASFLDDAGQDIEVVHVAE